MLPVTTIGFLHTADVHVATFRDLLTDLAPAAREVHVVDASLLADARTGGLTAGLATRLDERLAELAAAGADLIVCTCSTVGGLAEQSGRSGRVPVLRADRPMAEAAVAAGHRIAVVYATASTLEPTRDLLLGAAAGKPLTLIEAPCPEAWPAFENGDLSGYAQEVAAAARLAAPDADVIVLAQASMAPAAALLADLGVPVLTSPRTAVQGALARLTAPA
jgi:aspartate/glutamate racemase